MQLNEDWLRKWLRSDVSVERIAEQLTLAGLEVDSVTPVAPAFSGVVVAEVKECGPHPDADRLRVCVVNTGETTVQVVCGAPNVRAGLKVAFVKVGGLLPNDFKIKKAKLRGVESFGMICSSRELGLGDDHNGILELPDDAPVGEDFRDYFLLDDHIIDIDLTPNRGDCASVRGIARDLAVKMAIDFSEPEVIAPKVSLKAPTKKIDIAAPEAAPRYLCRVLRGINPHAKTPLWLRERLRRAGFRAIHPVVDISNYVMLEWGQPLHAFDLTKWQGDVHVRFAKKGEKLTLLDGKTVNLTAENLVIADDQQVQALAGVMGGNDSAVSENTQDLLLECAYFSAEPIIRSARALGLSTDSSYRFERGVDFKLQALAMQRFSQLLCDICGGELAPVSEFVNEQHLPVLTPILLRKPQVLRILGNSFSRPEIISVLSLLGCKVTWQDHDNWQVLPPSYRYDLRIEVDLLEELMRIRGCENIDAMPFLTPFRPKVKAPELPYLWLSRLLVDRGYHEAINYSFVNPDIQSAFTPAEQGLCLANPLTREMSVMRTSLWPGLLQALKQNLNHQVDRIRLFETGLCFIQNEGELLQVEKVAGVLAGRRHEQQWSQDDQSVDFFDLKGDVERILAAIGRLAGALWKPLTDTAVLHPGQSAELWVDGTCLGSLGALHPDLVATLDLSATPYVFELYLDKLTPAPRSFYKNVVKFPAVWRDIAIVVDEGIPAQVLESHIWASGGDLLQAVKLFDVYRGQGVESGKKSVALSLLFQDSGATLVDDQVNAVIERIVADLQQTFKASMRASI